MSSSALLRQVDVGIVETGRDEAAAGVDDRGRRAVPVPSRFLVPTDPGDPLADHRHGRRRRDRPRADVRAIRTELARSERLEDATADDQQVGCRAHQARPAWRCALTVGPLGRDDAEVGRVAKRAVGHDHVLAEDPLERRADPRERGARALVAGVRLELDPVGPERLERMGELEQLRLAVRAGPLERRCRPRSSRSRGACARARSTCSACCRSPGPEARSMVANGRSVPASALARAVSSHRRRPASSCGPMIVQRQSRRSNATRAGRRGGAPRAARVGRATLEDDRLDPRLDGMAGMAGRRPGPPAAAYDSVDEPRSHRRAARRPSRRAAPRHPCHVPPGRQRPPVARSGTSGRTVASRSRWPRRTASSSTSRATRGSRSWSRRTPCRTAGSRSAGSPS